MRISVPRYASSRREKGTLAERFWRRVEKTDGCWLWTGQNTTLGYGRLVTDDGRGRKMATHVSWELHYGPVPVGAILCHHCDNPPCVRPDHLFLGTPKTNAIDRGLKGRNPVPLKDVCRRGHPLTDADTRADGRHQCRICNNAYRRRWRAARHYVHEAERADRTAADALDAALRRTS